jgi:hypothetical protein
MVPGTKKRIPTPYSNFTAEASSSSSSIIMNVQNMSEQYPSPRWERGISQWASDSIRSSYTSTTRTESRVRKFGRTLCHLINEDFRNDATTATTTSTTPGINNHQQTTAVLRSIEMRFQHLFVLPPGEKVRFDVTRKAYPDSVYRIQCP